MVARVCHCQREDSTMVARVCHEQKSHSEDYAKNKGFTRKLQRSTETQNPALLTYHPLGRGVYMRKREGRQSRN